jgi:predicted MFS family arabinose efflux permease
VTSDPFGFTWQAIFLINVPIGLVALIGSVLFLGDSRSDHAQKLDIGGVLLLSVTLGLLVYPLVEGRETGWPLWIVIMLAASPVALIAFIGFEQRLTDRGGSPLVALALFRNGGFVIGVLMALALYLLASFYLTLSVYLQAGLRMTPLQAGLATLPYAAGYFVASLASAAIMRRIGARTLTLGFALQVLGFGAVALTVAGLLPLSLGAGLVCAGVGFGIVMPTVIGAVIGGVDARHAGLASGIAISTFQIGSALGVAIIGGVFFSVLGAHTGPTAYAHAFAIALGCNVALLALGGVLSLWLPDPPRRATASRPSSKS